MHYFLFIYADAFKILGKLVTLYFQGKILGKKMFFPKNFHKWFGKNVDI